MDSNKIKIILPHKDLANFNNAGRQFQLEKTYDCGYHKILKNQLIDAGIPESQLDISLGARLGYSSDVGPIKLAPLLVVGVRNHSDVVKACRFAYQHSIPITARGAGSGLPAQSVGSGIVLDMRSLDKMEIIADHRDGGKVILAQSGVVCTRLNDYLKEFNLFLASYPASTDMMPKKD